jgi:hypothetical protein
MLIDTLVYVPSILSPQLFHLIMLLYHNRIWPHSPHLTTIQTSTRDSVLPQPFQKANDLIRDQNVRWYPWLRSHFVLFFLLGWGTLRTNDFVRRCYHVVFFYMIDDLHSAHQQSIMSHELVPIIFHWQLLSYRPRVDECLLRDLLSFHIFICSCVLLSTL